MYIHMTPEILLQTTPMVSCLIKNQISCHSYGDIQAHAYYPIHLWYSVDTVQYYGTQLMQQAICMHAYYTQHVHSHFTHPT